MIYDLGFRITTVRLKFIKVIFLVFIILFCVLSAVTGANKVKRYQRLYRIDNFFCNFIFSHSIISRIESKSYLAKAQSSQSFKSINYKKDIDSNQNKMKVL